MVDFMRSGGFTMILLVILGGVQLVAAGRFAFAADPRLLALVRALTWAMVLAAVAGTAGNFITVCHAIVDNDEWLKAPVPYLIGGFGESVAPVVLGGSLASIAWILVAVGVRRMPATP